MSFIRYKAHAIIDPTKDHSPKELLINEDADIILNIITKNPENGRVYLSDDIDDDHGDTDYAITTLILHRKSVHIKKHFSGKYGEPYTEGDKLQIKLYRSADDAREAYNSFVVKYLSKETYVTEGTGKMIINRDVTEYIRKQYSSKKENPYKLVLPFKEESINDDIIITKHTW